MVGQEGAYERLGDGVFFLIGPPALSAVLIAFYSLISYTPPIIRLAREGNTEKVRLIISAGEDINETDTQGCTALLKAVSH